METQDKRSNGPLHAPVLEIVVHIVGAKKQIGLG